MLTRDLFAVAYLLVFFLLPTLLPVDLPDVTGRYDGARASVTVTFHVLHLPFCHGINVRPVWLFPIRP